MAIELSSGIQWGLLGIMRGPHSVPVCPAVPLSPSQPFPSPSSLTSLSVQIFLCGSCTARDSPHCPIHPLLSLPMTFLGLAAHVLVPLVRDNAQGWAGDVSLPLLFPFLPGKMVIHPPTLVT